MFTSLIESEREMQEFLLYQFLGVVLAFILGFSGLRVHAGDLTYSGGALALLHVLLFVNVRIVLSIHSGLTWLVVLRLAFFAVSSVVTTYDGYEVKPMDGLVALCLVVTLLTVILGRLNRTMEEIACRSR